MAAQRNVRFVSDEEAAGEHMAVTMHAHSAADTDGGAVPTDGDGAAATEEAFTLTLEGTGPEEQETEEQEEEEEEEEDGTAMAPSFNVEELLRRVEADLDGAPGNGDDGRDDAENEDEGVQVDDEAIVATVRLHEAIAAGNVDVAVELIRDTNGLVNANSVVPHEPNGLTPLMRACAAGVANQSMVYMLLQHGADIKALDTRDRSALMWACESDHGVLVRILIENGASAEGFSKDGASCLLLACENGDVKLVRYLLVTGKLKGSVNAMSPVDGLSALMLAVARKNTLLAALLIEQGADVNLGNNKSWPLSIACENSDIITAAYLIDKGATVNRTIDELNGISCLFQACDRGNIDLVKLLLMHQADVNHTDKRGRSVLSYLCENEGFQHLRSATVNALIAVLLKAGADALLRDHDGVTPVEFARTHPDPTVLEQMLSWVRQERRK